MIRLWTGVFLLAASWLPGTGYYRAPQWAAWSALVLAGCAFVVAARLPATGARDTAEIRCDLPLLFIPSGLLGLLCVLLLCLPIWVVPWPHRAVPLLLAAGLLMGWRRREIASPVTGQTELGALGRWKTALSQGLTLSGFVLGLQDLALLLYRTWTSYSHELPAPLPWLLAQVLRLLGMDAAAEQSTIHLFSMRQVHALGATWELLLPPSTWSFLISGLTLWAMRGATAETKPNPKNRGMLPKEWSKTVRAWTRHLLPWAVPVVIWLPLRMALLAGWMLHRTLQTEYEDPLSPMWPFWNAWVLIVVDLPLLLLQAGWLKSYLRARAVDAQAASQKEKHFVPASVPYVTAGSLASWREVAGAALPAVVAVVCLTLGVIWDPVGQRKGGRVAVDEFHSKWEPTERPFDTEWYGHLSGYNYWCIYDFSAHYYNMSRIKEPLTDALLANLDVLVLKVPTELFRPEEVEAVVQFVERGGGLLLIGEHTDVFSTGYDLNQIARRFGFEYRYDCVFGIDSFFDQFYVPSFAPHPVVHAVRGMDFATSCSIRPFEPWRGRSVITSTGLKNAPADYHASNFYPQAQDRADMRYGAFVQLWAVRHGNGRVLAFTDSTIFSNFCTFEPGKLDLLRGMLEWLNRQNRIGDPRWLLLALGAAGGLWAFWRLKKHPRLLVPLTAAGAAAWALTVTSMVVAQGRSFQLPAPVRPLRWVTIDRTICDGPLSKNGFIEGKPNGFGIFERWILRLGYFIRREKGPAALTDDLVVFFQPNRPVDAAFTEAARRYVEAGGHILVLDSAENTNSTSAALLAPFKLELRPHPQPDGTLEPPKDWHSTSAALLAPLKLELRSQPQPGGTREPAKDWLAITVQASREVVGGVPFCQLNGRPVAARAQLGRGTVTVLGIGARFADVRMGVTGDVEPDATLRQVYEFQFRLFRWLVEGDPAPGTSKRVESSR